MSVSLPPTMKMDGQVVVTAACALLISVVLYTKETKTTKEQAYMDARVDP